MIGKKYQDFQIYVITVSTHIGNHWQRLRISQAQTGDMLTAVTAWFTLWRLYTDQRTRTAIVNAEIPKQYKTLNATLKKLVRQIKYDHAIILTSEDIIELRIKGRKAGQ